MGALGILLWLLVLIAWAWPESLGRYIATVVLAYRAAIAKERSSGPSQDNDSARRQLKP